MPYLHSHRARQLPARAPRAALKPLLMAMSLAGLLPAMAMAQTSGNNLPNMTLVQGTVNTTTSTVATFNTGNSTVVVTNPGAAQATTINGTSYTTMTINQTSQRAVWDATDFNVAASHAFVNNGPSAASDTLVNVTGGSASNIYGLVQANNRLWLVNQAGIYVGAGGSVSAASVMLSARKVAPSEVNANYANFMDSSKQPALTLSMEGASANDFGVGYVTIDGQGSVQATGGIVVVAPNYIGNSGTVRSTNGGDISMLVGNDAVVQLGTSGFIELGALTSTVETNSNNLVRQVYNEGTIQADEGHVKLIEAGAGNDSLFLQMGAQQTQVATSGIYNTSTGVIRARSQDGHASVLLQTLGNIGSIYHFGAVDADGITPTVAGKGGTITLLGGDLIIDGTLTANGDAGGGQIDLINNRLTSNSVFVSDTSVVTANASVAGNGGTLRVLLAPNVNSDTQTTAITGTLNGASSSANLLGAWSAKGAGGGNGGKFILSGANASTWGASRTSSSGTTGATFDLSAPGGGTPGVWKMFAPLLLLGSETALTNAAQSSSYIGASGLRQDELNAVLAQGVNVSLGTYTDTNVNNGAARIEVLDGTQVASTYTGTQTLSLSSTGDIWLHSASGEGTAIKAGSGKLNISLKSDSDGDGLGDVLIYDNTSSTAALGAPGRATAQAVSAGSTPVELKTNGGNLDIEGSTAATGKKANGASVDIDNAVLDAGTGTINITGGLHQGWSTGVMTNLVTFYRTGVWLTDSTLTAQHINIHGRGMNSFGVGISQVDFNVNGGVLAVQGEAFNPANISEGYVAGVGIDSALVNLNGGRMTLRGLGNGSGSGSAVGVWIDNLEVAVTGQPAGGLPALDVVGTSTQSTQEGVRVEYRIDLHGATANDTTTADVAIGASADAGTSGSALELMYSEFKTIGRIGVRPAAFDGSSVTELVNLPIYVGAVPDSTLDTNFLVPTDLFNGYMGSGYNVVVGSSLHVGKITVANYTLNGATIATFQNQGEGSGGIYLGAQGGQPIQQPARAGRVQAQATSGLTNGGTINLLTAGLVSQTPTGQNGIVANNVNVVAGPNSDVLLSNPANQIDSLLINGGNTVNVASPGAATPSSATVTAYNASNNTFMAYTVSNTGATSSPSSSPDLQQAVSSSQATVQSTDVLNDTRTDVYVKGQMGAPQVCTPANVGGGQVLAITFDPLAQQWMQVRRSAQLSTCSAVRSDSACSAF